MHLPPDRGSGYRFSEDNFFHRAAGGRNQGTCKVLVSRIPSHVAKKDVHSLLSTFGNVTSCETRSSDGGNKDSHEHQAWYRVLVTFEAPEQAQQAVRNLSGYKYEGSVLRIDYHNETQTKRQNGAVGSRGGGRSGVVSGGGVSGYYPGPPMGPPPPPPRDIPLRMLVPSEMVGAIIGKSGATIKQITQQSRARVDVHRKDAMGIYNQGQLEKVINIYGSADNCSTACRKILEVMLQESAHGTHSDSAAAKKEEPIGLKLLAHNNLVGRVIGRAGAVIKKVMEETNAKINVSSMAGDPRERIVIIKGDLDEMSRAQQLITAKMRQCHEHDLHQAAMLGGGCGGMGMGMGAPPPPPPPPPHYGPSPFHRPPLPPPPPHYPPYGAMGVPAPNGHFYPPGDGSVETVHVWVPACTVGAIIGTGGSSIREMIRVSGCSIKVSPNSAREEMKSRDDSKDYGDLEMTNDVGDEKPCTSQGAESATKQGGVGIYPQPSDRRVTLTGSAEAQWRAQCLLYRKVFLEASQHLETNPEAQKDPQLANGHLRVEMNVPSNQVGRIIGKGGQTVKELQRLTHALIKLPEEASKAATGDEEAETPVHIIGDFYATQAAQRQIRALVARNACSHQGASSAQSKKKDEAAKTQKIDGDCNRSESQC